MLHPSCDLKPFATMNISKKMQAAFNAQITAELYSSNLYLQMAFWLRKEGWKGFAAWMFDHSNEEKEHALKMADFVLNRDYVGRHLILFIILIVVHFGYIGKETLLWY